MLAGLSSLHTVKLQSSSLSKQNVLLVQRNNLFHFQIGETARTIRMALLTIIAGLENCTCFDGDEPTDKEEF